MVQTTDGATHNEWIQYMKECSAAYKVMKAVQISAKVKESPVDCRKSVKRKRQPRKAQSIALIESVNPQL